MRIQGSAYMHARKVCDTDAWSRLAHNVRLRTMCVTDRACERSVSGAENGAERAENGVSGSGAESGLNRPLKVRSHQHCVDLVTDILR